MALRNTYRNDTDEKTGVNSGADPVVGEHAGHHNALAEASDAHEAAFGVIREALPSVEDPDIGASPTNSLAGNLAALQAALDTGRPYRVPGGRRYLYDGSLQLAQRSGLVGEHTYGIESVADPTVAESAIENVGTDPAVIFPNDGVGGYSQFAAVKLLGLSIASGGDCLSVPNGAIDVETDNLDLLPGQDAKGIHHKGFIQDWRNGFTRISGWRGTIAASANYGWYSDAEDGDGGDGCRMDCCSMGYFYVGGCAKNGVHARIPLSDNVSWDLLRVVTSAGHGLVLAGGLGGWVIRLNAEGNGYLGAGLSIAPTTGSITAGTDDLVVASAAGMTVGDVICVRGAADGLNDLVTTITNIAGTAITLDADAGYTVTAADVTTARYSDVYAGPDAGSPEGLGTTIGGGPQNITFINPGWGIWPLRDDHMLRYAADLSGITAPHIVNGKNQNLRPVYDPQYLAEPWEEDHYDLMPYRPTRGWRVPVMATGWTANPGFAVRRVGRRVIVRGSAIAGATAGTAVCTLPPGCRPSRLIDIGHLFGGGGICQIDSAGNVVSNVTALNTYALWEGASFSLD